MIERRRYLDQIIAKKENGMIKVITIGEEEKRLQEIRPLMRIPDSFKKIVVIKEPIIPWHDEGGILYLGIERFLLEEDALNL